MANSRRRERELARRRYERRRLREQQQRAKRRRRNTVAGAIVATLAVVGGLVALVLVLAGGDDKDKISAASKPSASATASASPTAAPEAPKKCAAIDPNPPAKEDPTVPPVTGKAFDASYPRHQPFELTLGQGQVIKGWDEGLVGMKAGGQRELIIPADKGYGATGSGTIKPNETLIFVVDLVKIG